MTQRILLVEDELGLVMTLSDRLTSEGYAVVTAQDGDTGLARATNETFDLIILDVMLPHRGGFDVCRGEGQEQGTERRVAKQPPHRRDCTYECTGPGRNARRNHL